MASPPRCLMTTELRKTITRKNPCNVSQQLYLLSFSLLFFSKTNVNIRDMSNCTKSGVQFQFRGSCDSSTIRGFSLFLSPSMYSTVDGTVRLVIAVTKFGL